MDEKVNNVYHKKGLELQSHNDGWKEVNLKNR